MQAKKLIEVAMPIKEISAESVRDKSLRHGHISTLHLWFARRPLPVCRAVVFASLVPDPLDENCPPIFNEAIELLLAKDNQKLFYQPYQDIPYTTIVDEMEDNNRNRLLMFIGKYSNVFIANEKNGKTTASKDTISDYSLIKWETHSNNEILNIARKLIWVFHNHNKFLTLNESLENFELFTAEIDKYFNIYTSTINRHLPSDQNNKNEKNYFKAVEDFQNNMPSVFDPFTGGGAIPLEASRLGCRSFGNDINPVAHIIQKATCEYPQIYGKPIKYTREEFDRIYTQVDIIQKIKNDNNEISFNDSIFISNRLVFDIKYYSEILISKIRNKCRNTLIDSIDNKEVVALLWVKQAKCSNPTCQKIVPLVKNFNLNSGHSLKPILKENNIDFDIEFCSSNLTAYVNRGNLSCPYCHSITSSDGVKEYIKSNPDSEKLVAIVLDGSGRKEYVSPNRINPEKLEKVIIDSNKIPNEGMQRNSAGGDTFSWGINKWNQLFSNRQLYHITSAIDILNEEIKPLISNCHNKDYSKIVSTYLSILIDKHLMYSTRHCRWISNLEAISNIYARQAIPMMMDFAESNIIGSSTGSLRSQLDWITRCVTEESQSHFKSSCINTTSGNISQFSEKYLDIVVTDPPYFDAIAYADISDFFYVWLKRMLLDEYPYNFATPSTPKSDECTALKHHHNNDFEKAKEHFEVTLRSIFKAVEIQTKDLISIMYAHQSTEAWSTLCNSILNADLNITSSWAIDTERSNSGMKADKAFLTSSVTVCARPSQRNGVGNYRKVKEDIKLRVINEVEKLYKIGFRGSDLLTACFGQAVSEFGKYLVVEKSDGTAVEVSELLDMAKDSAFNALVKGFDGDDSTKLYIGWLQLYGFTKNEHNTAVRIVQVGLSIDINDLYRDNILILDHNTITLAGYQERFELNKNLGERQNSSLIDKVHKAMFLFKSPNRNRLIEFISLNANTPENSFWRVVNAICEILPNDCDDYIQAIGLHSNKDSLIKESRSINKNITEQGQLEF
jgi:putative DNA methylase